MDIEIVVQVRVQDKVNIKSQDVVDDVYLALDKAGFNVKAWHVNAWLSFLFRSIAGPTHMLGPDRLMHVGDYTRVANVADVILNAAKNRARRLKKG